LFIKVKRHAIHRFGDDILQSHHLSIQRDTQAFKHQLHMNLSNHDDHNKKLRHGDALRSQTGIRPSLYPTTINAISQAILLYHQPSLDSTLPMKVSLNITTPLQVAIAAGTLAWKAIEQRRNVAASTSSLFHDYENLDHIDTESMFTEQEAQVISGRVVGVVLRMSQLESLLIGQVQKSSWIYKYNEYHIFGVCKDEYGRNNNTTTTQEETIQDRNSLLFIQDPLLRMCRAECLLALFIHGIEILSLRKAGVLEISGGSNCIDFIDQERLLFFRCAARFP